MDSGDFKASIESLSKTEQEKKEILLKANSSAEAILRKAGIDSKQLIEKAHENSVEEENMALAKARSEISVKSNELLEAAKKESDSIGRKKLSPKKSSELAAGILK